MTTPIYTAMQAVHTVAAQGNTRKQPTVIISFDDMDDAMRFKSVVRNSLKAALVYDRRLYEADGPTTICGCVLKIQGEAP